jgi:hypothetical protein
MRVFRRERLQFRVPALELGVTIVKLTDLSLETLDLCLKLPDLLGQALDLTLLHIRVRWPVKRRLHKSIFKELEEGAWPSQVGLVDLPVH